MSKALHQPRLLERPLLYVFMPILKISVLFALIILFTGCGTSRVFKTKPDFTNIEIGMTKAEVIQALGEPDDLRAQRGVSYLIYSDNVTAGLRAVEYFVRFVDGKVESFGRVGDFDSTKDPTLNVLINQR